MRVHEKWDDPVVSLLFWGVEYDRPAIPKSFLFFGENFLLLVCELFRAHEMRNQLEVTEMLKCKPYCVAPTNDARLRKPFRCCSAFRLLTRLGRHKRSSGRCKRSPGRSVSEAAPRFGNLCVFKPSALRKKPSASSEETFDSRKKPSDLRKKPSNLRRELRRKRISEKRSECRRHFFWRVPYVMFELPWKGGEARYNYCVIKPHGGLSITPDRH